MWWGWKRTDTTTPVVAGYARDEFLRVVHQFEPSRRYILLTPPLDTEDIDHIAALGKLPWSMVFHFNPDRESTSLQKAIGPVLESRIEASIALC